MFLYSNSTVAKAAGSSVHARLCNPIEKLMQCAPAVRWDPHCATISVVPVRSVHQTKLLNEMPPNSPTSSQADTRLPSQARLINLTTNHALAVPCREQPCCQCGEASVVLYSGSCEQYIHPRVHHHPRLRVCYCLLQCQLLRQQPRQRLHPCPNNALCFGADHFHWDDLQHCLRVFSYSD